MSSAATVFQRIEKACEILGVALLSVLCVLATLQIGFRYTGGLFDISAAWTEELARYFFVMMVLIGVPYTMRTGDDISIRPLLRRFSDRLQKWCLTVSNVFVVLLSLIMVYSAYIVSQRTLGTTLATVDWLRTGYIHVLLGVVFILAAVFAVEQTVQTWRQDEPSVTVSEPEPEKSGAEPKAIKSDGGASDE